MKGFETAELFPCFSDLFDFHVQYRELMHIYRHSFLANSIIDNGNNKILEFQNNLFFFNKFLIVKCKKQNSKYEQLFLIKFKQNFMSKYNQSVY